MKKKLKFITKGMENAIANHEFAKARFYSDEARKGQDSLKLLREKYKIEDARGVVTREIIEDVVSRWTGIAVESIRKSGLTDEPKG